MNKYLRKLSSCLAPADFSGLAVTASPSRRRALRGLRANLGPASCLTSVPVVLLLWLLLLIC